MRIVGGEFRGRSLATPKSDDIRPTTDRTRESLFNILNHAYAEALDGTIEGVIADWWFDDEINRTIHVDSRYMLWVMDKVDHAERLIKEMDVAK